ASLADDRREQRLPRVRQRLRYTH
ncbi:uncharacterized protein METZ01_LOCUS497218, partial [marine metagenome]